MTSPTPQDASAMALLAMRSDRSVTHRDRRSTLLPSVTSADVREAALTLFAERGYHGTSLKQIAESLELRTPSLYNHIDSKASLLSGIVIDTLTHVMTDFEQAIAGTEDPVEQLRRATFVYAQRHATHRRETLVVNQDATHLDEPDRTAVRQARREHERRYRQIIIAGKDSGALRVESPKLASFAIREMCVSVARWYRDGGEYTAEEVADAYTGYALEIAGASSRATNRRRPGARKPLKPEVV